MATMIRKQVYIGRRHEQLLKRLARRRKVSEAELIREALDRQLEQSTQGLPPEPAAWAEARHFIVRLRAASGQEPRRFRREDAYADRLDRWR
jgi:hypothetical protein